MFANIRRRQRDTEDGASAVEYGLLVAAIAALIVIVVFALGGVIQGTFHKTCSGISSAINGTGDCPTN
jgi:pilus assembly protein Flp/PilA